MASWVFIRAAPGEFRKLPHTTWVKFLDGKAALAPGSGGFVWAADFFMVIENRRAVGVYTLHLSKYEVDADGRRTETMRRKALVAAMDMVAEKSVARQERTLARMRGEATRTSVVQAQARLAYDRHHRWKPSPADLAALCVLVNGRAGWELLDEGILSALVKPGVIGRRLDSQFVCDACDRTVMHNEAKGHLPPQWGMAKLKDRDFQLCNVCFSLGASVGDPAPLLKARLKAKFGLTFDEEK